MNHDHPHPTTELVPPPPPERGIYCNRTLNLRSIRAIGYDMDYTLVHYNVREWEQCAYRHLRQRLAERGWPVAELEFDPDAMIRGLVIDRERGNIVKANRFGYVKAAAHGTRMLDFDEQKQIYGREVVDLSEDRWVFMNTSFSLSEAVMYAQLVDLLDARALPEVLGYSDLHECVRHTLDLAHMEGRLKAEITSDPERFVEPDGDAALALLDQRAAGKKLMLVTNSDWEYTNFMMAYAYDRFLPAGTSWRDLFDLVIVSARKPEFFWSHAPIYQVISEDGLLRPCPTGQLTDGAYVGGNARLVEQHLGLDGNDILFVGDHIYGDVNVSKNVRRWRTALILRELEAEMLAVASFRPQQERLVELMERKTELESAQARGRLALQRAQGGCAATEASSAELRQPLARLQQRLARLRQEINRLDEEIAPLAQASGELFNRRWGLLMRAGNDKSHLARQIERYADIYTSRVSNFLFATPYVYLRSPRGSLPHDPGATPDPWRGKTHRAQD